MNGVGWFDHRIMRVRVTLWLPGEGDTREVLVPAEPNMRFDRMTIAPGCEAPDTFTFQPQEATALRDALVQARGAPSQDERIAALEAEVRVLREWLGSKPQQTALPDEPSSEAISTALGAIERVITRDGSWRFGDYRQMREVLAAAYEVDG